MLAVLTGIPGTGKTTVAKKALEILRDDNVNYELVTYGDIMFDEAKCRGLVDDRDQMRKLDSKQQKEIQKESAKKISEIGAEKSILVDTHCTIRTPRGYLPGLPQEVLNELKPDVFILIEAGPEEIAVRRQGDKTRQRDGELTEEIRLHQELNRDIAMAYSVFTGCTVKIIENPQGKIDEAAEEMALVLK
ncbi:MAG: adenylate kinase [Candidatus Altiarchaeota archaeon]|nr:adenylate kinase [Candidatus Altiarchaeota archaeon]